MIALLNAANLLLAQTEKERQLTILGVSLFTIFILILFLDANIKNNLVPKNVNVKKFVLFLLIMSVAALILLIIYYI